MKTCTYTTNSRSMLQVVYKCAFFVAQKRKQDTKVEKNEIVAQQTETSKTPKLDETPKQSNVKKSKKKKKKRK